MVIRIMNTALTKLKDVTMYGDLNNEHNLN